MPFPGQASGGRGGALWLILAVALALIVPAAARADERSVAREHWDRGTTFYNLGKYDEAIKEFEAAYEAKNDPAFLYNLAQSHRLAGHTGDALRFYRTYLRYAPKGANSADSTQWIAELEKGAAERPSATPPPPPFAPPPAAPPDETPRSAAAHEPAAPIAPGGSAAASGTAGTVAPWSPSTGVPASAPAAEMPPATGTAGAPGDPSLTAAPAAPPSRTPRQTAGIAIGAAGAGVFVVGAVFGLVARSESKKVEDAASARQAFDPGVESLGKTSQTLQWVGYGVGVAALAAGVVLYLTSPKTSEQAVAPAASPTRVALAPVVSPNAGGALLRVAF